MRRRRSKLEVSTFPFLAVLLCTMGSLLLLLFIMDRRAKIAARNAAMEKLEARKERTRAEEEARQAEWEKAKQKLHALLLEEQKKLGLEAKNVQDNVIVIGNKLELVQAKYGQLENQAKSETDKIKEIQIVIADQRASLQQAEKKETKTKAEVIAAARELAELEAAFLLMLAQKDRDKQIYSVVPYRGKRGDMRPPIYVECNRQGILFHPEKKLLQGWEFNTLAVRAEVERRFGPLAVQRPNFDKSKPPEPMKGPYVLFLIRPDGIAHYYKAQNALRGYQVDFGYELVDENWVLDFARESFDKNAPTNPAPVFPPVSTGALGFGGGSMTGGAPGAGSIQGNSGPPPLAGYPGGGSGVPGSGNGGGFGGVGGVGNPGGRGGSALTGYPGGGPGNGGGFAVPPPPLSGYPGGASGVGSPIGIASLSGYPGGRSGVPGVGSASGNGGGFAVPPPPLPGYANGGGPGTVTGKPSIGGGGGPSLTGYPGSGSGTPGVGNAPGNSGGNASVPSPGGPGNSLGTPGYTPDAGNPRGTGAPPSTGYPAGVAGSSSVGNGNPGNGSGGTATGYPGNGADQGNRIPGTASGGPTTGNPGGDGGAVGGGQGGGPTTGSSGGGAPGSGQGGGADATQAPAGGNQSPSFVPFAKTSANPAPMQPYDPTAVVASNATGGRPEVIASSGQGNIPGGSTGGTGGGSDDGAGAVGPPPLPTYGAEPNRKPAPAPSPISKMLGNKDFVITIDCYADHVNVFPGGYLYRWTSANTQQVDQALTQTVTNLIARRQASVRPGEPPYRPTIRFQVSGGGLPSFYRAYPLLESLRVPMTRENVEN